MINRVQTKDNIGIACCFDIKDPNNGMSYIAVYTDDKHGNNNFLITKNTNVVTPLSIIAHSVVSYWQQFYYCALCGPTEKLRSVSYIKSNSAYNIWVSINATLFLFLVSFVPF